MNILIEGERYPIETLERLFESNHFYSTHGYEGIIKYVGYYYNAQCNELIFILPKVFILEEGKTVFNIAVLDLLHAFDGGSNVVNKDRDWIRSLTVYFYKTLVKFKNKFPNSSLINYSSLVQLKGVQKSFQYSYLDMVLSFVAYFKKHRHQILYKHIEAIKANPKKPSWEKTVRKGTPIIVNSSLIYGEIRSKSKVNNYDEQLIVYFYSILNYLNEQHDLGLHIEKVYPILKGTKFKLLLASGLTKLKKIKYRYYTDSMKEMHALCSLFFSIHDQGSGKIKQDFIAVNNYNIIFEDMIDNLFSDNLEIETGADDISLNDLKYHQDGKILDHIFDHQSLFDDSRIFYIGDSKYYKVGAEATGSSHFKQFTYAKNVMQYNIDLLNEGAAPYRAGQRYRDELTEGYNITPNFFIYGYIDEINNYNLSKLESNGDVKTSFHFKHRLFDRDTLFIHQYKINFLFVLKSYVTYRLSDINEFRRKSRELFRNQFIAYFSTEGHSEYTLYCYSGSQSIDEFVHSNFKLLHGKAYKTIGGELLLAVHKDDSSFKKNNFLVNFRKTAIQ